MPVLDENPAPAEPRVRGATYETSGAPPEPGFSIGICFTINTWLLPEPMSYETAATKLKLTALLSSRIGTGFCGLWEQINNPSFKRIEFDAFKNEAGANSFTLTPQKWIETTNARRIVSKSGRYGGTFAPGDYHSQKGLLN